MFIGACHLSGDGCCVSA